MTTHPDPHDPDVTVVASVSGGKDSTALSLWLTEQGIEHKRVHADTGWEHEETEKYVRTYLPGAIGQIDIVRAKRLMEERILQHGMFPSRVVRWCTRDLKALPIQRYCNQFDTEVVNVVGIRADESAARMKMPEWEFAKHYDGWVWRPLINWKLQDVIDIHARHGVTPNPLYLKYGAERVGCWPCINSRKSEIRRIAEIDPGRIDRIRELEAAANLVQLRKIDGRGGMDQADAKSKYGWKDYKPPTFFRLNGNQPAPIDDVVEWSRTSRGGKQYDMFDVLDKQDPGCVRWGLCDALPEEGGDE
jgi:3'-phosphoadenosine 5'-phosphosulfate sulfotransferase (PAPS reductase)/FAD synthetase